MTIPDIQFIDQSADTGTPFTEDLIDQSGELIAEGRPKFPPAILKVSDEQKEKFLIWLDERLDDLIASQKELQKKWAKQEESYRAKSVTPAFQPFAGSSSDTVPAIAMAVDPIHARLDTGIFKQDPVFSIKPLKKSFVAYADALSLWINYYQRHQLNLRQVASPRILELTKLGTCVFKTVYDRQQSKIKTYNKQTWEVVEREEVRFSGPRVFGISLGDFLFPPLYQHLQDCPIVAERQRTTYWDLKVAEAGGKVANVDDLRGQEITSRTELETAHEEASDHSEVRAEIDDLEVFEIWCDYDIDGDDLPEHLVVTYHKDTRTILQLRYNWYFHQRKPYTVIPYQITSDSLYGMGICEMVEPFQEALTKWHRMAQDNAYIANIRMFIAKKESGIEEIPRLYSGRVFFVDDPTKDFIPFSAGEIYPSTLTERQNIIGLVEKRTGVSDYLTGRESPIIGSRATATSTLALIQEGTKRVEEVLENIRFGMAEVIENCLYIWIQYGLGSLNDIVFGDDKTAEQLEAFFAEISAENVNGALAIDLSAADAAGSRQAMQQMQLQIIQIMMQYLEKLLAAGQAAIQAQQQMPQLAQMITEVMGAARKMFSDLLQKYDIRNPDDYLPDLEKYINGPAQAVGGAAGIPQGLPPGLEALGGLPVGGGASVGPRPAVPAIPGSGGIPNNGVPFTG